VRLPHRRLEAIYFDIPELRLARSGITLRYRTGEDGPPWTVKLPEGSSGATLRRREVSFEGASGPVPPQVADLVRAYARSRPLVPVARLHTDRTPIEIRGPDGGPLAEITDDRGAAYDEHGQQTGGFREVEVEIRAKPCRCAAEAAAPVCGHQADRFAAAIATVQAILGASPRHRRR
jgi:inorganic triphosphatase YgiF